jgi:dihydrofolate synthase/folylpolyglutamate synthase
MTYREVLAFLESFVNYERIPQYPYEESYKLERFKGFLSTIGNPQNDLRCIHVAGSKGKGSTCAFIAYILREAGYRVGLYTSPHLCDFRERIRIFLPQKPAPKEFEGMISERALSCLVSRLRNRLTTYNKQSRYGPLTFFEVYTALAFIYFKDKKTDFVVLETGLGGRLDATNVVSSLTSVITPISLEHTQKLGATLEKIAGEKAGIIKGRHALSPKHGIVVTAPQESQAMAVIRKRVRKCNLRLWVVGKNILYRGKESAFFVKGMRAAYPHLKIRLYGRHQLMNAASAIAAAETIQECRAGVTVDSVRKGLYNTCWPGRCEVVSGSPLVIVDGAQNRASCAVLVKAIRSNFDFRRIILVIGVSEDKDIEGIVSSLSTLTGVVITTRADNPRALNPGLLANYFKNKTVFNTSDTIQALKKARSLYRRTDLILVTGSLFVVGEVRAQFKKRKR